MATEKSYNRVKVANTACLGPPLSTSAIDFSHIAVRMDILSYPNEDDIKHVYYQEQGREAEQRVAQAPSVVTDLARSKSNLRYDGNHSALAPHGSVDKGAGKALFVIRTDEDGKTKKRTPTSPRNKNNRVWLLYGRLRTSAWKGGKK